MTEASTATKKTSTKAPKSATSPSKKASAKSGLFAVIATGGKQYRVQVGDSIKIEKLHPLTNSGQEVEYKEGDSISFDSVLMTDNGGTEVTLGNPFIKGGVVSATLKKIARYKTIDVIKYKQKSRYFKKYGHRQPYFEVQIDSVK